MRSLFRRLDDLRCVVEYGWVVGAWAVELTVAIANFSNRLYSMRSTARQVESMQLLGLARTLGPQNRISVVGSTLERSPGSAYGEDVSSA